MSFRMNNLWFSENSNYQYSVGMYLQIWRDCSMKFFYFVFHQTVPSGPNRLWLKLFILLKKFCGVIELLKCFPGIQDTGEMQNADVPDTNNAWVIQLYSGKICPYPEHKGNAKCQFLGNRWNANTCVRDTFKSFSFTVHWFFLTSDHFNSL